jgi:hypothetical protein
MLDTKFVAVESMQCGAVQVFGCSGWFLMKSISTALGIFHGNSARLAAYLNSIIEFLQPSGVRNHLKQVLLIS